MRPLACRSSNGATGAQAGSVRERRPSQMRHCRMNTTNNKERKAVISLAMKAK
jgi:hypothetical protein